MSIDRRKFMQTASAAALGMIMPGMETEAASPKAQTDVTNKVNAAAGYELKVLSTNWGYRGDLESYLAATKKEGYDGIEIWWPDDAKSQKELFSLLDKYKLSVGFLTGGWQKDPKEHLETFKKVVDGASGNAYAKPLYINCHSGRDHFSFDQNRKFIEYTIERSAKTGVPIHHETHRSRILFAAHIARQYMEKFPALTLTFDVSHWCNVHESMLADQQETLAMALERTGHIHARIGHSEGPQVNDPRAPEWNEVVEQHFAWWDKIVDRHKKKGAPLTILTEFGPPSYMPVLPYTAQPVADQWAINVHMMHLLRKRYQ